MPQRNTSRARRVLADDGRTYSLTIPWTSDRSKEYVASKSLASAMSALLTRNHPRKQPSAAAANQAFAEITANRHEQTWTAVPSTREP